MRFTQLVLAILIASFFSCQSNNPKDVSNEICDCLKEKYVAAKDKTQEERLKIGESCLLDNLNNRTNELMQSNDSSSGDNEIESVKLTGEISSVSMKSLDRNCIYYKTFTNDKLNQLRNEFGH